MPGRTPQGPRPIAPPAVAGELAPADQLVVDDGDVVDGVRWTAEAAPPSARDLQIVSSRLSRVRLTGLEIEELTLLDTVVEGCELSGAILPGWRCERVVFSDCRMSGLVAEGLRARHVRFTNCQLDGAWLHSAAFDQCELLDCDLTGADLTGARLTDTRLLGCRLDGAELSGVEAAEVALHGSSLAGAKGLASLGKLIIGSDQVLDVALPLLVAQGIRVDDEYLAPLDTEPSPG